MTKHKTYKKKIILFKLINLKLYIRKSKIKIITYDDILENINSRLET